MTFDSLYGRLPGDTSATEPMWPSLTDRDLVGSRSHGEGIPDRHHEGWHGHTISQVHDSAQKVLAADGEAAIPHPNVVMLLAGLTDIVHDEDVPTAPDRLSSLIDHIYTAAPDVAIVVGTLPPSDDTAIQARIDAYNDGVRSMVNDRIGEGDHLVLVDLSAVTTDDLVDGVHPGDQGYEKIADAFMAGIHWALVNGWIKDPPGASDIADACTNSVKPGVGSATDSGDSGDDSGQTVQDDASASGNNASDGVCDVLIVGDSISNGYEGDHTWRYRFWEWAREQQLGFNFVGPLTGTVKPNAPLPPQPPKLGEQTQEENADPAQFTGEYAKDVDETFAEGGSAHYAMWGRQLGQSVHTIEKVMNDLKAKQQTPDLLLVEMGFNDIGWLGADAGLVDTMKDFIDNARAVNPDVDIVLANVPQRTTLGDANRDLPKRITEYNWALAKAIPTWDTDTSPVAFVDLDAAMSCDPTATICPTAYDGLHPNQVGEYRIAQRFTVALHEEFGIGSEALAPPLSGSDSQRSVATPTGLEFDGTQQGVTVTWPKVFGAHGYDVQWRDITDNSAAEWQDSLPGARANRWDLGWQFTNQPWAGHTYEVRVRSAAGDVKSPWSDPVSGVANPTTAPPPADIVVFGAGEGSFDVRWTAAPRGPHTDSITRYALWVWDEDTPMVHSRIIGYPASERIAHVDGLTPGHRYRVFVSTWNAAGEGKPRTAATVTAR